MSEWISVKVQLPEYNARVFMVQVDSKIRFVGIRDHTDKDGEWFKSDNGLSMLGSITHWQPLPEPPNGDNK